MKQLALYGLNGVMNTLVGYLVFFALTQVIDYRIAIVIGYSVAMALSYALNSRIVFRGRGRPARFVVLNLGLMALNVAMTIETAARSERGRVRLIDAAFEALGSRLTTA